MKTLLTLALAFILTGCASMFGAVPTEKMTAEQIKEMAKIKDAGITCVSIGTPWGRQSALFVNVDKNVIMSGGIMVDPDCKATITNAPTKMP